MSALDNITKAVGDAATAVSQTVSDTYNYATSQGEAKSSEAKAEVAKETVKSDQTTLGQKFDGAKDYITNTADQKSNEAQAEGYKQKLQH